MSVGSSAYAINKAAVEQVPIADIQIGVRRRVKVGKLSGLQRSISEYGLIHPILLRGGNELVAGGRRLAACTELGWKTIPARRVDDLPDETLRALELLENTERVDLLDYETSKQRLAEMRQAEAEAISVRAPDRKSGGRGRPKGRSKGSVRSVSEATGVGKSTVAAIEKHVAIAEAHPFMQQPGWVQGQVLRAGEAIEKLPKKEHASVAVLLDQPGIPPKKAIELLNNLGAMEPAERKDIFEKAKSADQHDRSNALAAAAKLPPVPDPGLMLLIESRRGIERAAKECRLKGLGPQISGLLGAVDAVIENIRAAAKETRDAR